MSTPSEPVQPPPLALVFDDPLNRQTTDDTDLGWGESTDRADDDLARFLNEKPPHHL